MHIGCASSAWEHYLDGQFSFSCTMYKAICTNRRTLGHWDPCILQKSGVKPQKYSKKSKFDMRYKGMRKQTTVKFPKGKSRKTPLDIHVKL